MVTELKGHEQTITSAKIINSDSLIASCSNDSTVKLWDFKTHGSFENYKFTNYEKTFRLFTFFSQFLSFD